jgi:hypothetical protein
MAEVLRLRQQVAAREEVIRQLNRRLLSEAHTTEPEPAEMDQGALAEALSDSQDLMSRLEAAHQAVADREAEIASLRHQLGVYDRLGIGAALRGAQRVRRMAAGRTKP